MKTFIKHEFYADAGHGWLKVSKARLINMGIIDKISNYSFMRGDYVYLEEDCDVSTYVKTLMVQANVNTDVNSIEANKFIKEFHKHNNYNHTNRSSKIRNYERFEVRTAEEVSQLEELRKVILNLRHWTVKARKDIIKAKKSDLLFWKEHYSL
jgi:hypothetical protein